MSYVTDLPASAKILYAPHATFEGDESGWRATMAWVCDYADHDAFVSTVAGTNENVGSNITRVVPLRHPRYTHMLAYTVKTESFGHNATAAPSNLGYQYTKCKITVGFKNWPFPVVGDQPFMVIRLRHGNEAITIPGSGYKFPSTGNVIQGVDAAVVVATTAYNVTLYQCPTLNDSLITSLQSKVNSTTIFNQPVGTVRFDGGDSEIVQTVTGVITYTKSLTFMYRTASWNSLINPAGAWEAPVKVSDGTGIYQSADLTQLLQ